MVPIALSALYELAASAASTGDIARALALLTHVTAHPAAEHGLRARAIELHTSVASRIAPGETAALPRSQTLDMLVDELLQVVR
jgi:hypothetical protein